MVAQCIGGHGAVARLLLRPAVEQTGSSWCLCLLNRVLTRRYSSEPAALGSLVETAMLAACTGLAYHLSSAFRLEAYLGAFFPLPAVLSAARWSGAAAIKTMVRLAARLTCFAALTALRRLSPRSCYCCWAGRCAPPRTCCYTVRCAVDSCARCQH